MKFCFQFKLV